MTEQTLSYSIEIKDEPNEQVAIFTFAYVTDDELQIVLADFRRILGKMSSTVAVNLRSRS